jgi:hypothetical protein
MCLFAAILTMSLVDWYRSSIRRAPSQKLEQILDVLSKPNINHMELKNLCFTGIPEECDGLRALIWKLLLDYLPYD